MKYHWKPLDVNRLRLYQVKMTFQGHPEWDLVKIVAARSPRHALSLIEEAYKDAEWVVKPLLWAGALNIYQPVEWTE
jgi:hypothetical protein